MDATAVLRKTDAARELLSQRDDKLARALRSFLILVDGQRNLGQLAPAMQALGVNRDMIQHLEKQGLLQRLPGIRPNTRTEGGASLKRRGSPLTKDKHHSESDSDVLSELVSEALDNPNAASAMGQNRQGGDALPAADKRSLVGAKFYALNLIALMLAGQDAAAREAVREVTTTHQLATWLQSCADLVGRHAGTERAEVFVRKVWLELPDELRTALPGWMPD